VDAAHESGGDPHGHRCGEPADDERRDPARTRGLAVAAADSHDDEIRHQRQLTTARAIWRSGGLAEHGEHGLLEADALIGITDFAADAFGQRGDGVARERGTGESEIFDRVIDDDFGERAEGKSDGWVMANPYLKSNISVRAGMALDIR